MKKAFTGLHLELTNQCNLRCSHCYNVDYLDSDRDDLTTNQIKKIIDDALKIGVRDIGFSGGEPFMRQDIFELLGYVSGHPTHVLTNGMFITAKVIDKLQAIQDLLIEFRVSLDGLDSHVKIRGTSYRPALAGVKRLLAAGYVTSVNTMVTDDNIDELMTMYDLFKAIKLDRWRLGFVFGQGNAKINNLRFQARQDQLDKLKALILRHQAEHPSFELDVSKLYRSASLDGAHMIQYDIDSRPCSYQGALTVRPNGDVSYCPSLSMVYGNLVDEPMAQVLEQEGWLEVYDFKVAQLPDKCQNCDVLPYCGGGCRADSYYDTGVLESYSPLTCRLVRYYVAEILPHLASQMSAPYVI